MTDSRRRLAGLTSLARNLRSFQRSGSGTSRGALVSAMGSPTEKSSSGIGGSLVHESEDDGGRDHEVAGDEQRGEHDRGGVDRPLAPLVGLAERLGGGEDPVAEVHAEEDERDDVEQR